MLGARQPSYSLLFLIVLFQTILQSLDVEQFFIVQFILLCFGQNNMIIIKGVKF